MWSRDPTRAIAAADVFSIYERHWRHVDVARLEPRAAALIELLTRV